MPEQLKGAGLESVDMLVAIDPGTRNTGMAYFLRDRDDPKKIKLEFALQLDLDPKYEWSMIPSYLLGLIYKMAANYNTVYRHIQSEVPTRIHKIGIVIEQAVGKNNDQKKFIFGMQAASHAMQPWSPHKTIIKIVSAKTTREHLKLPVPPVGLRPSKAWEMRKAITMNHIQGNLGIVVPRHDTSDAIALGIAAIMAGKIRLAVTPFKEHCLDAWFIPQDVLQEELNKRTQPAPEEMPQLVIESDGKEHRHVLPDEFDEIHSMQRLQDDDDEEIEVV